MERAAIKVEYEESIKIPTDGISMYVENQINTIRINFEDIPYEYYINIANYDNKYYFFLYSGTYHTRAGDLLRYLTRQVSQMMIDVLQEENDEKNIASWCVAVQTEKIVLDSVLEKEIQSAVKRYLAEMVIIDAGTYFEESEGKVSTLPLYRKKAVPRCYVDLKKIQDELHLNDDTEIILQTLENESGVTLKFADAVFVMIGTNGEPYGIKKDKFSELYRTMEGNIGQTSVIELSKEFDIIPKAVLQGNGEEINLLDYAILCESVKRNQVYAEQISSGIYKVFSTRISGTNQYYLGEKGDWLTVDKDFPTSVHIVADIPFRKSYEII